MSSCTKRFHTLLRPLSYALATPVLLTLAALSLPSEGSAAEATVASATSPAPSITRRALMPSPGEAHLRIQRPRRDEDALYELRLERGKSVSASTEFRVKRVSVGDSELLDVLVLSPNELQFVTKGIGSTNVILWDNGGAPQAAIDVHIGAPYSGLESELRRVLNNENIAVDSAGESLVLKGSVSSAETMEQALQVANAFLVESKKSKIINLLEVGGNQQVMIEVIVAEMNRNLRRRLGANFQATIGSGGKTFQFGSLLNNLTSLDDEAFSFDLDSFELLELERTLDFSENVNLIGRGFGIGTGVYEVFLDLLQEEGLAKILAEPTVVARSGESASFLVGGEVPIPIAQGGAFGSITVMFKKFGVGVNFTPTVLSSDRIHLEVEPEVSEPDFSFGTTISGFTVPAFSTRRAATAVELGDGQSFAIAGLLRDDVTELVSKFPVLGDVPVLGTLFRSSQFQKKETELVLIVTPHLVKPLEPGRPPLPTDHFVEPSAFEFYFFGALEGRAAEDSAETKGENNQKQDSDVRLSSDVPSGLIGQAGQRLRALPEGEAQ